MREKAIALKYDEHEDDAPRVIAKGEGEMAHSILERAKLCNVPIQKDASLVELLSEVDVNEKIPEELYEVIAEVFAFIYQLDQNLKR
ncbi:EscU/YscU/HrcU family type III secretion system export apparatus switch protein [Bacillus sp. FJAT-47783]|uniref:EscU/YscU/HrcU family type III secretion system export apparatus switch protein n=1 Tax=Bacillus sp. FJAT-47783 TaxID=2922712 RepID=UPI001FAD2220|nr:EscU/YscU/HrcU family type III secretion system export apparatus switch protein [Bacillus sp. FJAT-47783]